MNNEMEARILRGAIVTGGFIYNPKVGYSAFPFLDEIAIGGVIQDLIDRLLLTESKPYPLLEVKLYKATEAGRQYVKQLANTSS